MNGYVYRWYCGACSEASDWFDSPGEAAHERNEHELTHTDKFSTPVVENPRIQRYPEAEAPGYEGNT